MSYSGSPEGNALPWGPFHSVRLDAGKCVGCTTCAERCPTQAIRLRDGRATIGAERCIDCGECIRACPHGAAWAASDRLSLIGRYAHKVALPAPALYGQFKELPSVDRVLSGLLELGFDEVFEVAEAAELVSGATMELLRRSGAEAALPRPLISSACPAVVRIIRLRFPNLIRHLVPLIPPMEAAARIVKETLHRGEEGVGVFFITPCAGKVTVTQAPLGYSASAIDGVLGFKDIYEPLRKALARAPERRLARAGRIGLEWARTEGESGDRARLGSLSVDGIGNVIGVLKALEKGELDDFQYVEALACPAGCVGGPLAVENPYVARARMRKLEDAAPPFPPRRRSFDQVPPLEWTEALDLQARHMAHADAPAALAVLEG